MHVVLHRPVEGAPKTVTLTRSRTGKWYACFSCEIEARALPASDEVVGVDVGLASLTVAKAEEAGRQVLPVSPRDTSRICSSCGELVQKTSSERIHTSPRCGLVMGRDQNAALNILHRGLQALRL